MRSAAIIAEYDPFHKGHAYQIEKTRRETGADFVIAVMSPDFVQRGEPAIFDKHVRTRLALLGGADLVLELPVSRAAGSAEFFARGAVSLIDGLSCVDVLSFGCETPDMQAMLYAARVLNEEPDDYKSLLRAELAQGASFPAARSKALLSCFKKEKEKTDSDLSSDHLEQIMRSPNNILALEYVRALLSLQSTVRPFMVERAGHGYHSTDTGRDSFSSATAIRKLIRESVSAQGLPADAEALAPTLSGLIPEQLIDPVCAALAKYGIPSEDRYDLLLQYALMEADSAGTLTSFLDVTDELASRISNSLKDYESAGQFTGLLSARNFPAAKVRRALLHVLLNIRSEETMRAHNACEAPYARILGFRRSASELMHTLRQTSRVPLITKPADAGRLLQGTALDAFEQDIRASRIYGMLFSGIRKENEYTRSPIIL